MKLTIGETWHREEPSYYEELTVEGLDAIEEDLARGEEVVPRDGDSTIEVRVINSILNDFHSTTMSLRHLNDKWERGEVER